MTISTTARRTRLGLTTAFLAAGSLLLSACAGGAGGGGGTASGGGEGFEWGASQEEVNEVIADLEPVELVYQAGAQSPQSISAHSANVFKEYVEERSNGQITMEIVWGQAIAGYAEIDDALADGRIDMSYALPIYNPAEYPAFDALSTASAGMPASPLVGELVGNAAVIDLAFQSEELAAEYEKQSLTPLLPMVSTGSYVSVCTDPGTTPDDWKGRQTRVASIAHEAQAKGLGASPVSMEYVETFEALQRGTIDCTFAQINPSEELGLFTVAPHVAHTTDANSLSGRGAGANLGGKGYQELPLAYQQIIFDAGQGGVTASAELLSDSGVAGLKQIKDAGGTITEMDPETDKKIGETNRQLLADIEEKGIVGDDISDRAAASVEKWSGVAAELGIEEKGDYESFDEWYNRDDYDFDSFAERLYEDVFLPHRPS